MNLIYDNEKGIAYQKDRSESVEYGKDNFNKLKDREYTDIDIAVVKSRIDLTMKYIRHTSKIIDIGCGIGSFIKRHPWNTIYGTEVNKYCLDILDPLFMMEDPYTDRTSYTFWDSLEHIAEPQKILFNVNPSYTI